MARQQEYCIGMIDDKGNLLRTWNTRQADAVAFAKMIWKHGGAGKVDGIRGIAVVGERHTKQPDGSFRMEGFEPFKAGDPIDW
jgi:hypothetical protein